MFDPTGGGLADIAAGAIVFVGDAETRIREDALRILRFFRFLAWYGRGEPDAEALAACAALSALVAGLSAERVSKELLTLLAAEDPRAAVRLMAATGVLARDRAGGRGLGRFEALVAIETEQLFTEDALLRLAALLPDDPDGRRRPGRSPAAVERPARPAGRRPRRGSAAGVVDEPAAGAPGRSGAWAPSAFCDRVTLAWAALGRPGAAIQWRALLPMARGWPRPTLPLTGEEVVAAGVPRGPMVGRGHARGRGLVDRQRLPRRPSLGHRSPQGHRPGHGLLSTLFPLWGKSRRSRGRGLQLDAGLSQAGAPSTPSGSPSPRGELYT